jgi:hypothetical protein
MSDFQISNKKNEKQKIPHCQNSSKSNRKITERDKTDTPNTKYMTAQFSGLLPAL